MAQSWYLAFKVCVIIDINIYLADFLDFVNHNEHLLSEYFWMKEIVWNDQLLLQNKISISYNR
jgi:hypothetical protein